MPGTRPSVIVSAASRILPKIALEEHFIIPSFMDYLLEALPAVTPDMKANLLRRLADFREERLAAMDSAGVTRSVLSISGPGVQIEPDTVKATKLAAAANDRLAKEVAERPTRYAGFAHVAMQDPKGAADELERCARSRLQWRHDQPPHQRGVSRRSGQ